MEENNDALLDAAMELLPNHENSLMYLNIRENVKFCKPSVPDMQTYLSQNLSFWNEVAPTLHIGQLGSTFRMHYEFASLNFVNEHLYGSPKIWYVNLFLKSLNKVRAIAIFF